jgi:hypothetical protein
MVAIFKDSRIINSSTSHTQKERNEMTDTRYFKTIAINRATGVTKVFYGFYNAAKDWLAAQ